jgi:outer membrane protein assembly factor BamA
MSPLKILFLLIITPQIVFSQEDLLSQSSVEKQLSYDVFPILMYDSDIGFGFGAKGIVKNLYKKDESFDLILFGSTKGEQWYSFTFSIPDFEIRQGKEFDLSFDAVMEYNKLLKGNFFGFGNESADNEWQFPRELSRIEFSVGHAFTSSLIGEIKSQYIHTSIYDYLDENPLMSVDVPGEGARQTFSLSSKLRWDTRDSHINPHIGWNINATADLALKWFATDFAFRRYKFEVNKYMPIFSHAHILAVRIWGQLTDGTAPYYSQGMIGGGNSLRGFKANRFIDSDMLLASVEYRFMIYKNLGAVLFTDAGRVFSDMTNGTFTNWKSNWGWGLRYYLTNFAVRFDMGVSNEGTRIFFNFGHVF